MMIWNFKPPKYQWGVVGEGQEGEQEQEQEQDTEPLCLQMQVLAYECSSFWEMVRLDQTTGQQKQKTSIQQNYEIWEGAKFTNKSKTNNMWSIEKPRTTLFSLLKVNFRFLTYSKQDTLLPCHADQRPFCSCFPPRSYRPTASQITPPSPSKTDSVPLLLEGHWKI